MFGVIGVCGVVIALFIAILVIRGKFGPGGVEMDIPSGFYNEAIEVGLNKTGLFMLQPVEIKYNLNGDDITNTGIMYDGKIKLEVPESGYTLYTITGAVCGDNNECSEPKAATYVLGKDLGNDVTLGIININSSQENLYDYHKGILVGGITYDMNKKTSNGFVEGNYNNRGENWEREAYITVFNKDGEILEDGSARIEVSGGSTAAFDVKSLKVTVLCEENGISCAKEFRLRSGGQDQLASNIRSSVVSRLAQESGFDGEPGTERVVVFLNGEFYGIFDKQMNYSKQNLMLRHNLKKKKQIVKYKGSEMQVFDEFEINRGFWQNLDKIENREKLEELVDMDNYLKYYAIQILTNNNDWPMNNFGAWKYEGQELGNKYEDGRIRFLIYDTDLAYYTSEMLYGFPEAVDIFGTLMDKWNESTFKLVMESDYYREKFIGLLEELMNGPFRTENVLRIIDEEVEKIEHQTKLFYSEDRYGRWEAQLRLLKQAVEKRNDEIKELVLEYFGVRLGA